MSEMVQRLRERRAQVWEQMKTIADRSTEENRNLTAEEQGQWDVMNEELDKLDQRIKAALDTEQRAKDADEAFERLHGGGQRSGGSGGGQVERRGEQPAAQGGNSEELRSFLRGERGRFFDVTPDGPVDYRTLVKGTATAGGNTVPTGFYDRLIAHLIEVSAIMQAGATILNTNSGEVIQVPKTTAHSSAAIVTEGNAIGVSDPAFGQVPLGAYKYGTMIQVSRELLDDTGVDLEGYLAMQAGRALGNAFGAHAIAGTGTGQPRGILTDATLGVTGQSGVTGGFSGDNMIDLFYSVIAPYRASASCKWIMRDATVGAARKLKDTTGQYIWQPSLQAGAPDLLLGKPVLTDPNVPAVGLSAKSVLFGDFSQFFVRFAGGVRFERSDDYAFNTDLVTFRALLRADCSLVDLTGAVKYYAGNAA
ncbi:phage major capsid protein [Streptomyces cyanogenus]|uniref:Phage capsid family protein n=1 Tax=Streptomyces cyanogenus TaxID=80860 RepID=A0ABX7TN05_STRCY|nr:phage major capsid protein [Streptomyces cyanogenus]QTD96978.1 Phage capsid family protein [Streptomyces cyanogenus]